MTGTGSGEPDATATGDAQSLGTKAAHGYLWAFLGTGSRFLAALILASLLARELSKDQYSTMVALTVVMLYADTALDLGMGAALIYEQEVGLTRRVQVAFTANLTFAVVLGAVITAVAPLLASIFHLESFVNVFRCIGVLVLLSGLNTVPWALFSRSMDFKRRAYTELARDGTRVVITVALVAGGYGIWGVVWGFVASKLVWASGTWILTRFRPAIAWDRTIVGELFAYAWRMAGTRFLGLLALNGDYFVVGNRSSGLDLYYQAFRLPEIAMGSQLNAMSAVLFPMYSRIRSQGTEAMRSAMHKALRMVGLFSIPVGVGLALVARDAITVMFGTGDTAAVPTMEILSLTGAVVGLGFATGDLLFATNRPGVLMRLNAVMVPVMLAAMWFVAPHGIQWVAMVHLVIGITFTVVRQLIVNRIVGSDARSCVATLWPGTAVALGVVLSALPVRLLSAPGLGSAAMVVAAGVVGGAVSLAVSGQARGELTDLIAKIRG